MPTNNILIKDVWFDGTNLHVITVDNRHIVYVNAQFVDDDIKADKTYVCSSDARKLDERG